MDERVDARGVGRFPGISIAPLSKVTKERCIPHWGGTLLVPLDGVPRKALYEAGFENPEKGCSLGGRMKFYGHFERGFVPFLR
jgi:hypothetical protein